MSAVFDQTNNISFIYKRSHPNICGDHKSSKLVDDFFLRLRLLISLPSHRGLEHADATPWILVPLQKYSSFWV